MASKEVSPRGIGSGIHMIQYFINHAGRDLPASRKHELEKAKRILIKLLFSGKQILISSLVFILLANTTNLTFLNTIADEKEDMADALRGMEFVNDDNDDTGLKAVAIEQACKDSYGGEWTDNSWCKFDKDKQATGADIEFEHELEVRGLLYLYQDKETGTDEWEKYEQEKYEKGLAQEAAAVEKAAQEDALCDDEDADSTNIKTCMSDKREQQDKNVEQTCEKVDGKMTKDGFCDTDGSGDTPKADRFNDELMKLEQEQEQEQEQEEEEDASFEQVQKQMQQVLEQEDYPRTTGLIYETPAVEAETTDEDGDSIATGDSNDNEENEMTPEEADDINEQNEQEEEKVAENNEEDDNQVNIDTLYKNE